LKHYLQLIGPGSDLCKKEAKTDIVFVLDASGSVRRRNFRRVLNFVAKIVSQFNIGSDDVRVGMVLYSSKADVLWDFLEYTNKEELVEAIDGIR